MAGLEGKAGGGETNNEDVSKALMGDRETPDQGGGWGVKERVPSGDTFYFILFYFIIFGHAARLACGILVPRPGIETVPPAVEVQSPNHWTAREVPGDTWWVGLKHVCEFYGTLPMESWH